MAVGVRGLMPRKGLLPLGVEDGIRWSVSWLEVVEQTGKRDLDQSLALARSEAG